MLRALARENSAEGNQKGNGDGRGEIRGKDTALKWSLGITILSYMKIHRNTLDKDDLDINKTYLKINKSNENVKK